MLQTEFESQVSNIGNVAGTATQIEEIVRRAKAYDVAALHTLCALLARAAFLTPEAIPAVYDAVTRSWLGLDAEAFPTLPRQQAALAFLRKTPGLPRAFWNSFWQLAADASSPIAAEEITARVSALARDLPPSFNERAEMFACSHPGVTAPAERVAPGLFSPQILGTLPPGSLGHDFYRMIVDHKFDLEVLDRNLEELRNLPPALQFLNVRMLQMHDIWHIAAGYTTSSLHENALASFQLAQCGHLYSAMFLATILYVSHAYNPVAPEMLLQVVAEAWHHSRQSPSFMDIDWEAEWHLPVDEIRKRHGIKPFDSIYKHTLIEEARALSSNKVAKCVDWLAKKLGLQVRLSKATLQLHVWAVAREKRQLS